MPDPAPPAPRHLPLLDVVRIACALLVMAYHYMPLLARPGTAPGLWFGWIGVPIFFLLSGHVIAASAIDRDTLGFAQRRWRRLAPAVWLCASLTALVLLATRTLAVRTIVERWLAALVFIPLRMPIDATYWTLGVETLFYALIALRLATGAPSAARIEATGWALGAASIAFWLGALALGIPPRVVLAMPGWRLTLLPHGVYFATGIALWAYGHRPAHRWRPYATMVLLAACTIPIAGDVARAAAEQGQAYGIAMPLALFLTGAAVIGGAHRWGWVSPPWLATLGRATFPLYLLHHVIGLAMILALAQGGWPLPVAIGVTGGAMVVLASLVTVHGEPAMLRLAARIDGLRRHAPWRDTHPIASPPAG